MRQRIELIRSEVSFRAAYGTVLAVEDPSLPSVRRFRSKIIVLWVSLQLCIVTGSYKQEPTITKSFPDEFLKKIHFLPTVKVVVNFATFTMKRTHVRSIFP